MLKSRSLLVVVAFCLVFAVSKAQPTNSCADLADLKIDGVEITKAAPFPRAQPFRRRIPALPAIGPLPAHCRVDGVIHRRKGADGEEFGIGFAVALPGARKPGTATS